MDIGYTVYLITAGCNSILESLRYTFSRELMQGANQIQFDDERCDGYSEKKFKILGRHVVF